MKQLVSIILATLVTASSFAQNVEINPGAKVRLQNTNIMVSCKKELGDNEICTYYCTCDIKNHYYHLQVIAYKNPTTVLREYGMAYGNERLCKEAMDASNECQIFNEQCKVRAP
ncbi:MAG: hypothetical protein KA116_01890 [Proteobacteria bacterium]|nr:hypothetical protein [Pseudomonadota bacterium]